MTGVSAALLWAEQIQLRSQKLPDNAGVAVTQSKSLFGRITSPPIQTPALKRKSWETMENPNGTPRTKPTGRMSSQPGEGALGGGE